MFGIVEAAACLMTFRLPVTNWDGASIRMSNAKLATNVKSNQIILLSYGAVNDQGVVFVYGKGR